MSIAPATIRAHEEDVFPYNGVDYFQLDDRGNAYENHLIVVRNIETGVITIRTTDPVLQIRMQAWIDKVRANLVRAGI